MGLFKKKDKSARMTSPAPVPDTTPSQGASNPYAYSPPPPSYKSQPAYNEPTSYGGYRNEPTAYGGPSYNNRAPEPTTYGGSAYGGGNTSRIPEPTSYGASVYSNDNRPSNMNSNSSNPYGGKPSGGNPYGGNPSGGNPYGSAPSQYNRQPEPETYSAAPGGYHYGGSSYQDSYGYQTTALADDEQDPELIKQEIKFTKYASKASTVNALHAAARAEQAGQSTLLSLEEQGEKLRSTQLNLQIAKTHGDIAAHQAKDLKVANRALFMPHVKNPFSSGPNKALEEQVSLERQRRERSERGSIAKVTHEEKMRKLGLAPSGIPKPLSLEEKARQRSMYQFEADEEDEQLENDIDNNLDQLAGASGRLKGLAYAIQQKVDEDNKLIVDIGNQAHDVQDGIVRNGQKLRPYGF
ncbi:Protein transport protein S9 plasma membrane t-SNARE [Arthrobotrys megalospora]